MLPPPMPEWPFAEPVPDDAAGDRPTRAGGEGPAGRADEPLCEAG